MFHNDPTYTGLCLTVSPPEYIEYPRNQESIDASNIGSRLSYKCPRHSKCVNTSNLGWLVGCIEDLRRFSGISAISRLGSGRKPISEIQMARREIEPRTSFSASKELNHSPTTAPNTSNLDWMLNQASVTSFTPTVHLKSLLSNFY